MTILEFFKGLKLSVLQILKSYQNKLYHILYLCNKIIQQFVFFALQSNYFLLFLKTLNFAMNSLNGHSRLSTVSAKGLWWIQTEI